MSNTHMPSYESLPSREEIIQRITDKWVVTRETEIIPVDEAVNRIPVVDVFSTVSLPVVRASGGDGIAVDSSRFTDGMPDTSPWILGQDFVRADTGDDFDDAFDAVIMIEDVDIDGDGKLTICDGVEVTPGKNVRQAGSTVKTGDPLIKAYLPLRPKDLAGLHMGGVQRVEVLKKPEVAYIPSGSELISPGTPLTRGKNIDANSVLVRETLLQFGADPLCFPIVCDDEQSLDQTLTDALQKADIVVISGGSSKGEEDCTATLLHRRGLVLCHGSQAAPGKPLCAAIVDGKPVVNMPGPFLAAYHGLEWCLNALVSHYLKQPKRQRQTVKATLTKDLRGSDMVSMFNFVEVNRKNDGSGFWATPLGIREVPLWRGIAANGQYMTKLNEYLPKGGEIEVELLRGVECIPVADE